MLPDPKPLTKGKAGALIKSVYLLKKDPVDLGMGLFGNEKLIREGPEFPARLVTFDTSRGVPHFPMWKNDRWWNKIRNLPALDLDPAFG